MGNIIILCFERDEQVLVQIDVRRVVRVGVITQAACWSKYAVIPTITARPKSWVLQDANRKHM